MTILFGYRKHHSVSTVLLELRLPSFSTVLLHSTPVFTVRALSATTDGVLHSFHR